MGEKAPRRFGTLAMLGIVGVGAFTAGLIIGLPVLGWWLWPVQWTDIPQTPLATHTPYPTYTPFPTFTPSPLPPTATPVPDAIVIVPTLSLLEGPGEGYAVLGQVNQEEELGVVGQYANCEWLKVTALGGVTGWVPGDTSSLQLQLLCEAVPDGTFRPFTGVLKPPANSGEGRLSVENGTPSDGLVMLAGAANPSEALLAAYVRSEETYLVEGIPDGEYILYFATGSDWNGNARQFVLTERTQRFEESFDFVTTARNYTIWTISLQPKPGGTGQTDSISPDQLPAIK